MRPSATIDPAAKIALSRARQLAAAGAAELATTEFERAAALAPNWVEAQRALALWQSRQEQWEAAAIAWNRVMSLIRDKRGKEYREATTAFAHARRNLPPEWQLPTAPTKTQIKTPHQSTVTKQVEKPKEVVAVTPPRLGPPRLTQRPPTSRPTVTAPSGVLLRPPTVAGPRPAPPGNRIAQSFRRGSTPSLRPRRAAMSSTVPPAVRVAPRRPSRPAHRMVATPAPKEQEAKKQEAAASSLKLAARAVQLKQYEVALKLYQRVLSSDPQHQQARQGVVQTLFLLKRYDAVEAIYRRALTIRPDDLTALHGLSRVLLARRDAAGAIGVYQQVLAADEDNFIAAFQIAQLLTRMRRYEAAETYYRKALTLQPANAEVWAAWGEALAARRDTRVRGVFERALQLRPGYVRARLGLAGLFAGNNDYANAVGNYQAVLRTVPRHVTALIGLGDALTYFDREAAAAGYYRRALDIVPDSLAAQLGLGRALIYTRQYKQGIPHLLDVLKKAPENEEAVQLLVFARTKATAHGEAAAIADYEWLLKRQRGMNDQAETWAAIGQLKTRQGDLTGASAAYSTAYRLAPTDPEITIAYAHSLAHQDQWLEAAPLVAGVLRRDPENVHALALQLMTEHHAGNGERANGLVDQLMALEPASIQDAMHIARALRQAGRIELARRILYRVAARNPDDVTLKLRVANAARILGDQQAVIELCRGVLTVEPRHTEARFKMIEALIVEQQFEAARLELAGETARPEKNSGNNLRAELLTAIIALRGSSRADLSAVTKRAAALLVAYPRNAAVRLLAGDVKSAGHSYRAALDHYRAALQTDEDNLEARLGLARTLHRLRRIDESLVQYQELMRRAPDDTTVKLECADLCLEQKKLADAELLYNQVLALCRSFAPPIAARLGAAADRKYAAEVTAIFNRRISSWRTASTAIPAQSPAAASPLFEQVLALRGLGEIRRRQERFADAETYFRRALQLESADGAARLGLARSLRGDGRSATALDLWF